MIALKEVFRVLRPGGRSMTCGVATHEVPLRARRALKSWRRAVGYSRAHLDYGDRMCVVGFRDGEVVGGD
jgi:ubiquinone/menaquinone biosynthesis C-methylase UbiE